MQNNKNLETANNEINLKDMVNFVKRNQMVIVLWGLAGLVFSTAYAVLMPNKYEARWQMQMAQFAITTTTTTTTYNSEEPAALIQRLREPTAYPVEVRQSCDVQGDGEFADYLDGVLKIETIKNVINATGMKVRHSSPEQAKQCAEAIVAMVVSQQHSLIEEHLAGRQAQLVKYQQALVEEQQQLEKIKKSEIGNFGYLAKLDKLSWLRTRIDALQEEALLSQMHPAKLMAPIYAPSKPVSPKVGAALLLGMLLGLMSGVLHAVGRERWVPGRMSDL